MARTDDRGGQATKRRIATTASQLFTERGFEEVTVTEVARATGVSSVTVFKYFPKKEDLFFDRANEFTDLFLAAVHGHRTRTDVLDAIHTFLIDLLDQQHPLSGTDPRSMGFFRTVAQSPSLIARARQIAADIQDRMTRELEDAEFDGDAALVAAFLISGYMRAFVETATSLINETAHDVLRDQHRARLHRLFVALTTGVL